jgi:hypothetical protein
MLAGVLFAAEPVWLMVAGMSLMSFGEGLSFGVLYRFALMSSPVAKGTVSAAMSMLSMAGYALGIELFRLAYMAGGMAGFASLLGIDCRAVCAAGAPYRAAGHGRARRAGRLPAAGAAGPEQLNRDFPSPSTRCDGFCRQSTGFLPNSAVTGKAIRLYNRRLEIAYHQEHPQ